MMATTPSNAVNLPAAVIRPVEAKPSRDASVNSGAKDFGKALKREMDRADQSVASKSEPAVSTPEPAPQESIKDAAAETAPVNEQAAQPWLAMLQGVAIPAPIVAEVSDAPELIPAEQETKPDLASLLGASITPQAALASSSAEIDSTQQPISPTVATLIGTPPTELSASAATTDAAIVAVDPAKLAAIPLRADVDTRSFTEELSSKLTPVPEQGAVNNNVATKAAVTTPVHHVATPVGDTRWGEAVAQRVGIMLGRQEQKIEMTLNPPNLGPMEVRLNLSQEQASVVFTSQNAAVREALAAATPRLTALLADQGIVLTNVQVASDSLQQQQQQASQQSNQQTQSRVAGAALGVTYGESPETRLELGDIRLPQARGGVSLFV